MCNIKTVLIFLFLITCICLAAVLCLAPEEIIKQSDPKKISGDQMAKIEIYTKSYCPYCVKAKALLKRKGLAFEEVDIENDTALALQVMERAGGRKTVPQIFIDGAHIGGCDDLYALEDSDKLDAMLK